MIDNPSYVWLCCNDVCYVVDNHARILPDEICHVTDIRKQRSCNVHETRLQRGLQRAYNVGNNAPTAWHEHDYVFIYDQH